jgi:PTH1 family peptidyl-tRNA hydrolase
MLVDRLAERLDVKFARMQLRALIADARYEGHRLILVKPQTYMNESGQAVAALQKFYKMPLRNVIVAFDEMDLPLGRIRMRPKGGSSGHNGMKSIIRRLSNSQAFPRIRLGIGRPPGQMPPPAYLLQDFSKDQVEILPGFLDEAADAVLAFVTDGVSNAMNRYNGDTLNNA